MECPSCRGRREVRQFDPGTRERWLTVCPDCLGTGRALSSGEREIRALLRRPSRWIPALVLILFLCGAFLLITYLLDRGREAGADDAVELPAQSP
ncbi:MAG TPA: hypothetical protein VMN36_00395 [Verrucomicrobiales bacterium]|nr:hypothetical protein [Verrucomicrobiales bacterium]